MCGCILGKPVETDPTLDELRTALDGDRRLAARRLHQRATDHRRRVPRASTRRGRERSASGSAYVAPDDDINYTLLGYLVLSEHGAGVHARPTGATWLDNLVPGCTYGPERTILARLTTASTARSPVDLDTIADELNPGEELCGAMIRADAYGYACPGQPELAAELAWRDAGLTHRRTGIYGSMFAAAAIATAFVERDPLEVFATASRYVPRRSRFRESVEIGLEEVARSTDWLDGYRRINARLGRFGHCRIHQEVGNARQHVALGGVGRPRHLHAGQPGQRHRLLRRDGRRPARHLVRSRTPRRSLAGTVPRRDPHAARRLVRIVARRARPTGSPRCLGSPSTSEQKTISQNWVRQSGMR